MSDSKNFNKSFKIVKQNEKKFALKKKKITLIRFMIPFDIFCLSCNSSINEGKKINAFKEKIISQNYLGLKIFRFYFKCLFCSKGLSIKTDVKNFKYYAELNCRKIPKKLRYEKKKT